MRVIFGEDGCRLGELFVDSGEMLTTALLEEGFVPLEWG